jgi:hypothetical protein
MNSKRFWWSVVAVWVVMNLTNWFFHGVWLAPWYEQTAQFWRPGAEMQQYMWVMWITSFVWSWAFVWIYSKGLSAANPWGQAFRYAGAIIALSIIPDVAQSWAVSPYPAQLVWRWLIIGAVQATLCACVMTWTFKPQWAWKGKAV